MFRTHSLAVFCLTFGLFLTADAPQANATWGCFSGARYSSSYFHDYYNYGARYSHRSYGSYYGNYGVRAYRGYGFGYRGGYRGHYGGWSTYAPYSYTPAVRYVGYGSSYGGGGCNTCAPQPVVVNQCAPTCCSAGIAYGPGCFSGGCGIRRRCGLLGPFRRARYGYGYGVYGSYGYSSYGW